jgi:phosphoglucosamine mutase
MQKADVPLQELVAGIAKAPQVLINVDVEAPGAVAVHPLLTEAQASYEQQMGARGRILIRPSGTEPLLRIMVEGEDEAEVNQVAKDLAAQARSIQAA